MSYFYAFKNRIDFAGSGLSEVKKSDIDIAVNIAGGGSLFGISASYVWKFGAMGVLQFCRRQVGIVFYGNLLNRGG